MTTEHLPTRQECIDAAGECLAEATRGLFRGTPREVAERAYTPTGPSIDVIEQKIIAIRAEARAAARAAS